MADASVTSPKDIGATAQAAGTFKTLLAALTEVELADVFEGAGPLVRRFRAVDPTYRRLIETSFCLPPTTVADRS